MGGGEGWQTNTMVEAYTVFLIIAVALVLFVSEAVPTDITAIGVIVALASMRPVFGIDVGVAPTDAIAGFANPATVTIVAMFMLSAGIRESGLVERLGIMLARFTAGDERRTLLATLGATGPTAGFVNNTPVVAVFIPMITEVANRNQISPSKLLLPLSYAAILGGTLTLIGTSTNLIASNLADVLIEDRGPIGFFEFTHLGAILLLVGFAYLMTVGRWLTPDHISPAEDLTELFAIDDHLYQLGVREDSPLVGTPVAAVEAPPGVELIQLERGRESSVPATSDRSIEPGDRLVVLGRFGAVESFASTNSLLRLYGRRVDDATFADPERGDTLAKLVVPGDSDYVGKTLEESRLGRRYETRVLAINRKGDTFHEGLDAIKLRSGDTLLVRSNEAALSYLGDRGDLIRVDSPPFELLIDDGPDPVGRNEILAIATMVGVVVLAAVDILPIVIAALAGVIAMVLLGVLTPSDAYDAVSWNVIFLLAGVIPLGLAMQETGGAAMLAEVVYASGDHLPMVGVLLLLVVITGLLANVITPVATVVLMIPIAVDTAVRLGANEFAFLLGVMFASATSFMTPVGYQTNLMIYGPGGYRFTDFVRVGGPLQLLSALVITLGIAFFWGVGAG